VVLCASLWLFDGGARAPPVPRGERGLVSNVFLLFAVAHAPVAVWVAAVGGSTVCAEYHASALILLAIPAAHLVAVLTIPGYCLVQPTCGGFDFMVLHSYAWMLFAVALLVHITSAANGFCNTYATLGLSFVGCVTFSMSLRLFNSPAPERSRKGVARLSNEGVGSFLLSIAGGVGAWSAVISTGIVTWPSQEGLGWLLISIIVALTAGGFHILFTWTHALVAVCVLLTENTFALAVCASCGLEICVAWYCTLVRCYHLKVPSRGFNGWGEWLCSGVLVPLCGCMHGWRPEKMPQWPLVVAFHCIDFGVHLFPPAALLQIAAPHISPLAVVMGHLALRSWLVHASFYHFCFLPEHLREGEINPQRLPSRPEVLKEAKSTLATALRKVLLLEGLVSHEVVNFIYGMDPPLPTKDLDFLVASDFVIFVGMLVLSFLPQPLRTTVFFDLGGGAVVSVPVLMGMVAVAVALGGAVLVSGAAGHYWTAWRPQFQRGKVEAGKAE